MAEFDEELYGIDDATEFLAHYGIKRRSGRYPWGSGKDPYQRTGDFLAIVERIKSEGWHETPEEIKDAFGMSTTEYRRMIRLAKHERRNRQIAHIQSALGDEKSVSQIGRELGINESSVRSLMNKNTETNKNKAEKTAERLKEILKEKGMIDVGAGVERELGISRETLEEAILIMELDDYNAYPMGVKQMTAVRQRTPSVVLANPDVPYADVYKRIGEVGTVEDYHSDDGGLTFRKTQYPASIDSSRVKIRYADEKDSNGNPGIDKDGFIEIRRGVEDLDLGASRYAQVRILVDGTHYIKGMAAYSDDIPDGVDIVFNTNKKAGTPMTDVLKGIKTEDPNNPFGAAIKAGGQTMYIGKDGKQHLSPINKLKEEGDWESMSSTLSQQFLAKQPIQTIKKQLGLTYADYMDEYAEIMTITNPLIKKKALEDFGDSLDAACVTLKAKALPKQKTAVLIPMPHLKDGEIYDPNHENGEQVCLIRFPHGGQFEIPVLTVNNRNQKSRKILPPDVRDAVGVPKAAAEQLSGADFDGDHVLVLPLNGSVRIRTKKVLKGLENFDDKMEYPYVEGIRTMRKSEVQREMGMISNLITDMTLQGASETDLTNAVRHSMVIIDAHKHKLNYKQSELDHNIAELRKRYQTWTDEEGRQHEGGASTLLSRRKQNVPVPERKYTGRINPETGEREYYETGRTYVDKKGKTQVAMTDMARIHTVRDAHEISTGTAEEAAYADYINQLKALANRARKDSLSTGKHEYSPEARKEYQTQVDSLKAKIDTAAKNAPRERYANRLANMRLKAILDANPDMSKADIKKQTQRLMTEAREEVSASGRTSKFDVTDIEWEAIQKGAVSSNVLSDILRYANEDRITELSRPHTQRGMTANQEAKAQRMAKSGYTIAEIAEALGKSTSTISKVLSGGE